MLLESIAPPVVFATLGLAFILWPRTVVRLHTFFWVAGGEPSDFGLLIRIEGLALLGGLVPLLVSRLISLK